MSATILVGVDGTEPSRAAIRWSVKRATGVGAEVRLAHVIDDEFAMIGARMLRDLREDAHRLVEVEADYARSLAPEIAVSTVSLHGSLMQELTTASRNMDMVAVGTHKTGYINGKIFGSRSLWLAAAAQVPVAIIPQTSHRDGRGIVVGVDESEAGRHAIRFAAQEAERANETLTLLRAFTVSDPANANDEARRELDQQMEDRNTDMLSRASEIVRSLAPAVEVRTRSIRRAAAAALADASASAALLVIGSSRREGSPMLGSISHDVLINLTGPTIVVHPAG